MPRCLRRGHPLSPQFPSGTLLPFLLFFGKTQHNLPQQLPVTPSLSSQGELAESIVFDSCPTVEANTFIYLMVYASVY